MDNNPIGELMQNTMESVKNILKVDTVVGDPIYTPDGITLVPISKVSVGFGGGGSDFTTKSSRPGEDNPFGGGAGGGVKVTPICFLIVKDGAVRMMPVTEPASTTADRIVEMVPDTLDKISAFIDSRTEKKAE